ncbi:MAG TPA: CHASE2 domain-containing protein, partial [Candidatus Wallbacteria bacterium]|nr:CHASE2 domain-containing protein [Candidatus Wallbacteria bacterium]
MKIKYNYRITACYMIIFILSFYAGMVSVNFKWIASLENKFRTFFHNAAIKSSTDYKIVIVGIDDSSFQAIKTEAALAAYKNFIWPWPQGFHADFLEKLAQTGVSCVGFGIPFPESFEKTYLPEYCSPKKLISMKKKYEIPVVLASRDNAGNITRPPDAYLQNGFMQGFTNITDAAFSGALKYNFMQKNGDSFALAVARCNNGDAELIRNGWTRDNLKKWRFMTFKNSQGLSFPIISYSDVLLDRVPKDIQMIWGKKTLKELLNQKTALIGLTSSGADDMISTPAGRMHEIEFHANALSMLYNSETKALAETGPRAQIFLTTAALVAGLLIISFFSGFAFCAMAGFLFCAIYISLAALIFSVYSFIIPVANILFAHLMFIAFSKAMAAAIERKGKMFLRGAFGKYVSPDVAGLMLENPELISLGGVRKEIS